MSTVTPAEMSVHWDLITPIPDEPIDPYADDDRLGLLSLELTAAEPADACLGLADWIDVQAAYHCSKPGIASQWLGRKIRELADMAVRHGATTPDQLDERMRLEDLERDEAIYTRGQTAGYESAVSDSYRGRYPL